MCPNCSKPLLRILSLSAADSRLDVDPEKTGVVHLLYCWTCSIPYGVFSYRIRQNGSVELVEVPPAWEGQFGPAGPYDGYTGQYALKRVGLIPLPEQEQTRQKSAQLDMDLAFEMLSEQKHQVGGFPVIANSQDITCPVCRKESALLSVICDDASGNEPGGVPPEESFTDYSAVQMVFHFCRDCSVVSAYHSGD